MLRYVNSRIIDGKTYTAKRDDVDPTIQAIECDGLVKQCRLKEVWNNDDKIKALFR